MNILKLKTPDMVNQARKKSKGSKLGMEILWFVVVFLIVSTLESMILVVPIIIWMVKDMSGVVESYVNQEISIDEYIDQCMQVAFNMPEWLMILQLFATVGLIAAVVFFVKVIQKRTLYTMGVYRKGAVKEYLLGLGIGLVMFTLVMGINILSGSMTISIGTAGVSLIWMLPLYFVAYMIQGASEELLCRGYFFVSVSRWNPIWVGLLANSIAFACLHLMNSGISVLAFVNLFLFGVFMTVYVIKRNHLLGACAIHTVWNFAEGNLYGTSVSGMTKCTSLISSENAGSTGIINGGAFGPEGGLAVTMVLIVAIAVVWIILPARQPKKQEVL